MWGCQLKTGAIMSPYCRFLHSNDVPKSMSLRNIYLFCVGSGWTRPDKPLWTFNKSSHWRRKTFKTDWLTADSFMTKLLLLRSENSSLAKSMIVYSCVSVSPFIWTESFTSPQHYKTRVPLIDRSYDSSCHVTPAVFLQVCNHATQPITAFDAQRGRWLCK